MNMGRRELLSGAGAIIGSSLISGKALAVIAQRSSREMEEHVQEVVTSRIAIKERNTTLKQGPEFRLRIRNDHEWNLVFGIFGITDRMQLRRTVGGESSYQGSRREVIGGERVAVVWDEWSEAILDVQSFLVEGDIMIEISEEGLMTIS